MERLFSKAPKLCCEIELNQFDMTYAASEEDAVLRQLKIAKSCGCKFYPGNDAHKPEESKTARAAFGNIVSRLYPTENDKHYIPITKR